MVGCSTLQLPGGRNIEFLSSLSANQTEFLVNEVVKIKCKSGFFFQKGIGIIETECLGNNLWFPPTERLFCTGKLMVVL